MSLRIVFAGTPDVAVPALRAAHAQHEVMAVITRPDAPVGRKRILTPSPVAQTATELGLPIIHAARITPELTAHVRALDADLGIVVAYGAILPDDLLAAPASGWVNVHFSRLPHWRGAAPVQRAIEAGETALGVSVIRVVSALDAGPICDEAVVDLGPDATADDALAALASASVPMLDGVLSQIEGGTLTTRDQQGEPSYAHKLTRADGRIDWSLGRQRIYDRIRAMTSEPGAWCVDGDAPLKILSAGPAAQMTELGPQKDGRPGRVVVEAGRVFVQCHDGFVPIREVQPAGRRAMSALDWMAGNHDRRVVLS